MSAWWNIGRYWKRNRDAVGLDGGLDGGLDAGRVDAGRVGARGSVRLGGGYGVFDVGVGSATSVATVFRCVQLLSDRVAGLELQYLRRRGERYVEDEGSAMGYLLSMEPQPEMSAFVFWGAVVQRMLLDGDAYIYPRYVLGELTDLVLCSRGSVSCDVLNGVYGVCDGYNGVWGTFGEDEMIHLFLHSSDGRRGESVISHARRTLGIASAGDVETANRFVNGGTVRGLLSNDRTVSGFGEYADEELSRAAMDVDSRFKAGEGIVSLPGQVDFKQISLSSADMQFLESRKFTVREVCRFFGVHPSYVFDDTSNNYKSAEMATVDFMSSTLDPILRRIECELNRKLIGRGRYGMERIMYDRKGVYSLDLSSRADYQRKTIECGIYTVNDWRRKENQPEVEGGDRVYVSAQWVPMGGNDGVLKTE